MELLYVILLTLNVVSNLLTYLFSLGEFNEKVLIMGCCRPASRISQDRSESSRLRSLNIQNQIGGSHTIDAVKDGI